MNGSGDEGAAEAFATAGSASAKASAAIRNANKGDLLDWVLRFDYSRFIQKNLNDQIRTQASIGDLAGLRVLANTQRHRILALLIAEPVTAAGIAERLAMPRTRVYYHLDLLERHGFISVVEKRAAPLAERIFRAVAASFRVDRRLLGREADALNEARSELLDATAEDVRRVPATDDELLVQRSFVRLNAARRQALRSSLIALIRDFSEGDRDGMEVEVAIAMFNYPSP